MTGSSLDAFSLPSSVDISPVKAGERRRVVVVDGRNACVVIPFFGIARRGVEHMGWGYTVGALGSVDHYTRVLQLVAWRCTVNEAGEILNLPLTSM